MPGRQLIRPLLEPLSCAHAVRLAGEAVLYIFDLGYWAYELFDTIIAQQQHFISRLREACNPRILKVFVGRADWVGSPSALKCNTGRGTTNLKIRT
jgi:hypothetical protein